MSTINKLPISLFLIVLLFLSCSSSEDTWEIDDLTNHIKVERNNDNKDYTITINQSYGSWDLYSGTTPENINQKIASWDNSKVFFLRDYSSTSRMYFKYVFEKNSSIIVSERLLPMEGAYNVRDLGGYKTMNGNSVKWGKVFRSGDLNLLTDNDLQYLNNIAVKSIIDFRGSDEIDAAPDKTPASCISRYSYPINTGNIIDMSQITTFEEAENILVDGNRYFITDCQEEYKAFFKVLMDEHNLPLLFHCSAGKDRAGLAAALFLSSVGVDRQTIINDYMLSAEYVKEKYASTVAEMPILEPLFTTKVEYIEAAFSTIDSQYGGIESYLTKQLEVDMAKMKRIYTE